MKVIIAGSRRSIPYYKVVQYILTCPICCKISEVVSGGASGVDLYGEKWARKNGIPIKRFSADWAKFGKRAGPIRNVEMANYANGLIAVWDGQSRGTKHMINVAKDKWLVVYVYNVGSLELETL